MIIAPGFNNEMIVLFLIAGSLGSWYLKSAVELSMSSVPFYKIIAYRKRHMLKKILTVALFH